MYFEFARPHQKMAILLAAVAISAAANTGVQLDVDWAQFLSRNDLLWDWRWCVIRKFSEFSVP